MISNITVEPIRRKRNIPKETEFFHTRTTCTKIKYHSYKQAVRELKKQQKYGTRVKRVYLCPICKSYHLTSIGIDELEY